ncbi:manganese efflux pump MntP family protein [Candidatus Lokiarchaeum ossiferum]|uniref:manganese efflux pump MntP family protein n=1 Tax=Candidatus Lokiarchaeum ossiferum TaxID=2951803 RepID=UPI00352EBD13
MDAFTLIFLILGLSLDDFVLAFAIGLVQPENTKQNKFIFALRIAGAFTISTTTISLIGWQVGALFMDLLSTIGAWIMLIVFGFAGYWIIKEAKEEENEQKYKEKTIFSFWSLLLIGLLASIDEGVVSITFSFLDLSIPLLIILLIIANFLFGVLGVYLGGIKSKLNPFWIKIMIGLFFIMIGIKNWITQIF